MVVLDRLFKNKRVKEQNAVAESISQPEDSVTIRKRQDRKYRD